MPEEINYKDEIESNHKKDAVRRELFKKHGYDTEKERGFIIEKSLPLSGKILEVGTGKGHFAIELAKKGYKLTSVDVSAEDQRIARLNLAYCGFENFVELKTENAESMSFKDDSFNAVFLVNTLHHLKNPFKVLSELIRITSLEGKLIISDFSKQGFDALDKIHASEGTVHEVGKVKLSDIECHLLSKGFRIEKFSSQLQEVLVIRFGNTFSFDLFA